MSIFQQFKQFLCKHEFDVDDLVENRGVSESCRISWTCFKCGKTYTRNCGLDILKHGIIADKAKGKE